MENENLFWTLAEQLQAEDPRVCEGTIMSSRCLRVGEEFLALCDAKSEGLVVKLPKDRISALIGAGQGDSFAPASRVFREWLLVQKPDRRRWLALLREGIDFVA